MLQRRAKAARQEGSIPNPVAGMFASVRSKMVRANPPGDAASIEAVLIQFSRVNSRFKLSLTQFLVQHGAASGPPGHPSAEYRGGGAPLIVLWVNPARCNPRSRSGGKSGWLVCYSAGFQTWVSDDRRCPARHTLQSLPHGKSRPRLPPGKPSVCCNPFRVEENWYHVNPG